MTLGLGSVVGAYRRRRAKSRGVDWHKGTVVRLFNPKSGGRFTATIQTVCGQKFSWRSDLLDEMQREPLNRHAGDRLCPTCWT